MWSSSSASASVSEKLKKYRARDLQKKDHTTAVAGAENGDRRPSEKDAADSATSPSPSSPASPKKKRLPPPPALPRLSEVCINTITQHADAVDCILDEKVGPLYWKQISPKFPLDLDVSIAATRVTDEQYWKRKAKHNGWLGLHPNEGLGETWKQVCLEYTIQQDIENCRLDASEPDIELIFKRVVACQEFVKTLRITQTPLRFDLLRLCSLLPRLEALYLTYASKRLGMSFDRSYFGVKLSDATSLGRYLESAPRLRVLSLQSNLLEDDTVSVLFRAFGKKPTSLTELDLSHNRISDAGARLIASMIGNPAVPLVKVNLADNAIYADGAGAIAQALVSNGNLQSLDLRLNRLGDAGGRSIFDALLQNNHLRELNLSCNDLETESAQALADLLEQKPEGTLMHIDLTGNLLTEEMIASVVAAFERCRNLTQFDVRGNPIAAQSELLEAIELVLMRNIASARE